MNRDLYCSFPHPELLAQAAVARIWASLKHRVQELEDLGFISLAIFLFQHQERLIVSELVDFEILESCEKERAQFSTVSIESVKGFFSQEMNQKLLRGIFCFFRRAPAVTGKGIERAPVTLADFFKSSLRVFTASLRAPDKTPACFRKGSMAPFIPYHEPIFTAVS